MTNEHGYCPNCNADLDGDSIWEHFFQKTGNEEKADKAAEVYGATREKGKFGRAIALYDRDQDRTVAWKCPDCEYAWERT
jgi:hypothetical protein